MDYFEQYKDKNILSVALVFILTIPAIILIDIIGNEILGMNISYEVLMFLIAYVLFFLYLISKTKRDNVNLKSLIGDPKGYFFLVDVLILYVLMYFLMSNVGILYDSILYSINKDFAIKSLKSSIEMDTLKLDYNFNSLLLFISVVIGAPIIEEIVFRGMILQKFNYKYKYVKAILLSSLIFAVIHLDIYVYPYFLGGVSMCLLTYKYKSLIPAMVLHFINNTLSIVIDIFSGKSLKIEDYNNAFIESIEYMNTVDFWVLLFLSITLYFGYIYLNRNYFKVVNNKFY